MLHLPACPLCQEKQLTPFLTCQDYTVSHETFQLEKCSHCAFVLTNPQPEEQQLPRYYQSDAYISHSNKSLSIVDQVYKISRRFTLKWKYDLILQYSISQPESILDYGCGTGSFLGECKKHQLKIQGVEPSSSARRVATETIGKEILSSLTQVNLKSDIITLWHVLEHVVDLHGTIEALKAHLHETGTMFIAVPNHQSIDAQVYGQHWAGYDVPRHLWHFSKDTMERLVTQHHLNLVNVVPMQLDAYYVSLLSHKYKTKKNSVSNMMAATIQAWKSNKSARRTGEFSSLIYIVRK